MTPLVTLESAILNIKFENIIVKIKSNQLMRKGQVTTESFLHSLVIKMKLTGFG